MAKVYVPQVPTRYDSETARHVPIFDLSAAAQYGELVTIIDAPLQRRDALKKIRGTIIEESDYILAVGDVALLAAAIVHTMRRNGKASLLRWDRTRMTYVVEEIEDE